MSLPHLLMWAIVLVVGFPSAWKNPTAGALVGCYLFSEGLCLLTGNGLATEYFLYPDFFVIAVIMMKPEACNYQPYRGAWHQLQCLLLERSAADRIVLLLYPLAWYFYAADVPAHTRYWALWLIAVAQFAAAGAEGLSKLYRSRAVSETPDRPSGDVFRRLAWSRGYG